MRIVLLLLLLSLLFVSCGGEEEPEGLSPIEDPIEALANAEDKANAFYQNNGYFIKHASAQGFEELRSYISQDLDHTVSITSDTQDIEGEDSVYILTTSTAKDNMRLAVLFEGTLFVQDTYIKKNGDLITEIQRLKISPASGE